MKRPNLFDPSWLEGPEATAQFLSGILDASTEYSIIGKDLDGTILLWNEGARRIYGHDPADVVGKAKSDLLHAPEDVEAGVPQQILEAALREGRWEGTVARVRKSGERFPARVVVTPRRDASDQAVGFLLISKDVSGEIHLTEELRAAQYYTRSLIESNIDALMTTDPLGVITDVNRQMCEVSGYDREELLGTRFSQHFTDPERGDEGIRRVLAEDRVTNYELVLKSRDGGETAVSFNASTFRDADGRLKGVFAAARDITEQKRLEEDLRRVQNYTRGLIEASVDALVTVDPEYRITDVNEQMVRMIGYGRQELIGSAFPDYFTDPEAAIAGVQRTLDEGLVTNYVLVLRPSSGQEIPVSFNASIFRDPEGDVRGIFASARDITEQKHLQDQLTQAQNYTRGLIESSVDAMITVDPELTITDVNEQMARLTEVPREQLIGSRFDGYFTDPQQAASGVRRTLREAFVTNYELTLRTPGDREVLVSFNASVFKDTEGHVRGIFAVARDVTEQRRLEEELREQQNYSRSLIEASVDALMTVDPSGTITDVNEQTVRMFGLPRARLVGSRFAGYFTEPDRAEAGVRTTFEEGFVTNYELLVQPRAGSSIPVSFNAAVFRDTAGEVQGILAAAREISQQKTIEQELREQQTYARGLIESNIDALVTIDPLGIITDVNRQMCEVTGLSREELIGTTFKTYFTDPARAEDGVRQTLSEGQVKNYELTIRSQNGREVVVSYNATTFHDTEGRLKGVFAAARDITDQKRLEEQLRQAQNYNRGLIESSVDAMLTVDPDLTITDVNEQMVRLSGYSREALVGSSFADYFREPDRAAAGVRQTLDEGYVTNYELTLRSRHRREILVAFNASVFKDTEGNVLGIFAVARDVTEQRRLEGQLRESENYNRSLIESSVDALVTVDPDLVITDVNEQTVRLTGYSRDELIGSAFRDYFTEPEQAAAGVRKTFAEGQVTDYELVLRARSGKRVVVSFNAGVFRDTEGRVAGILAAARDITAQKRLAQELAEQQAYNRSLIEASVDALMTVDPSGVVTDVNEQTVRLLGHNRKQLVGGPFAEYFTEPERADAGVKKTFAEGVVTNYELVVRSRTGRKIPVSFNAAVFRNPDGEVVGILAAAREITQQKAIEQELREQQNYTRGLIESNIDALMTTDTLGIITDVNEQMVRITGYGRLELVSSPFKDYFTDPQRAEDGIRLTLEEGQVTNYELTIRARDGKETVVSYNATTFRDSEGRLKGVFAGARDITEQKRLEGEIQRQYKELLETSTFLNNVLESSTEYSIIAVDLEGRILAWNEGARRNYGHTSEQMVGTGDVRVLHVPEDLESGRVDEFFQTALTTGKAEGTFERVRRGGERFTASVAMSLRQDAGGNPVGYVIISKDITQQKLLEAQLQRKNEELEEQYQRVQEANRLKSEFLANMSHELRTPLNGIIGFAELMHDGKVGPVSPDHQEYLGDILTSARHLLQLINDVLDLSKVESGKMEFAPERLQPAKVIQEVRDILRTLAARKRMQVEVDIDAQVSEVVVDPAKFKQILYNYLSNAIKFTPDEGRVTVRVKPEGPETFRLEVEDTGIGIRDEDAGRLFREFEQLDASAAKKYPGTGLGLALTKRLVEAQGGTVGVSSTFGQGTVFFAVLPRRAPGAASPAGERREERARGALTTQPLVLVVEDDQRDREWLVKTLTEAGYAVQTAATGAEATVRARKRRFDALVLDLLLPDMHGKEVLHAIRSSGPNSEVPVVVVTVVSDQGALGAAVQDYLVKPVRAADLLQALGRAGVAPGVEHGVLVVDDDPKALKLMQRHLKRLGYKPLCFNSAEAALDAVREQAPAAVLLDLLMEGMDGFQFLRALRGMRGGREIPVIVWTVKDLTPKEARFLGRMAEGVVPKGLGAPALLKELEAVAGSPALDAETRAAP